MPTARTIGTDLLRACLVLALVFLSFAHAPASGSGPHQTLTATVDMSWCGAAPDTGETAHAPCHACRLGSGADLPTPCATLLLRRTVADVHYGALPVPHLPAVPTAHYSARGPPAA